MQVLKKPDYVIPENSNFCFPALYPSCCSYSELGGNRRLSKRPKVCSLGVCIAYEVLKVVTITVR